MKTAFDLPQAFQSTTLGANLHSGRSGEIPSVHLNGRYRDYPEVTFSPFDYGRALAVGSIGYQHLVADLMDHGAVFVGTILDEPDLWRCLELRRMDGPAKPEVRPGSYLVSRSLDRARQELLSDLQIDFIEMTAEEFALDVLNGMLPAAEMGLE